MPSSKKTLFESTWRERRRVAGPKSRPCRKLRRPQRSLINRRSETRPNKAFAKPLRATDQAAVKARSFRADIGFGAAFRRWPCRSVRPAPIAAAGLTLAMYCAAGQAVVPRTLRSGAPPKWCTAQIGLPRLRLSGPQNRCPISASLCLWSPPRRAFPQARGINTNRQSAAADSNRLPVSEARRERLWV